MTTVTDEQQARIDAYNEKRAARVERLKERADNATREAEQRFAAAFGIIENIPPGQPILVGHHSEGRHRRDLARHDAGMRKGFEMQKKAEALRNAAEAAEDNTTISSDDPQAIEKLTARVESLEAKQEAMKKANAAIRLKDQAKGDAKLAEMGYSPAEIVKLRTPDYCKRIGYPSFETTNNNANIRRLKQRIEQLKAQEAARIKAQADDAPPAEVQHQTRAGMVKVIRNHEENRIQLIFPGKPDEETRRLLKSHGFRWSPRFTAWQRHLNNAGIYAAAQMLRTLKA